MSRGQRAVFGVIAGGGLLLGALELPRARRHLSALDEILTTPPAHDRRVWEPCAGSGAAWRTPFDSLALNVALRVDCVTPLQAAVPRDEVEAFWSGVAMVRRGDRQGALAVWHRAGASSYFLNAALGKTPPEPEAGALFLDFLTTLHPDDWKLQYRSGQQLRELKPERAFGPLERAAALRPASAEVHAELGLVSARLQRFAAAAIHYERARTLDPANPVILQGLGEAHYYSGNLPAALVAFRAKAAALPGDETVAFWIRRITSELGV